MKHNSLISVFLFLTTVSSSAIQSVGKGGGFAEMKVYAIDRNLSKVVQFCLNSVHVCKLNLEQIAITQEFALYLNSDANTLTEVNVSCIEPFVHKGINEKVSIDSCFLYESGIADFGPVPKSNELLFLQVSKAKLLSFNPKFDELTIDSLSQKLLTTFQITEKQFPVPVQGLKMRLHMTQLGIDQWMTLETFESSYGLTEELVKILDCDRANLNWNLNSFYFKDSKLGATGKSHITWFCRLPGGSIQHFQGILYLDITMEKSKVSKLQLQVYQKETL